MVSIQAPVFPSVPGAEVPDSHMAVCTLNALPGSPPGPQGLWLPAAGWPWIQLVCGKDLCEKAVKSLIGGLCPLAQELHLSPGPCPWSLPYLVCRYACVQPDWHLAGSALALLIWLSGLTWNIPHHHRLVRWSQDYCVNLATTIRPALLLFRYCGTAPPPVRSLPYLRCHSAAGLPFPCGAGHPCSSMTVGFKALTAQVVRKFGCNYHSNWTVSKQ